MRDSDLGIRSLDHVCVSSAIFCLFFSPADRSVEDVEAIFEELQHMEVFASFPTAVKRQLARVVVFEHHAGVGTVGESRKSLLNSKRK